MALDSATIVRAALDLLKDEGLAGVTFRRLTAVLGVKAPAIYWRFADKRELLDAMAEAILAEAFADQPPWQGTPSWRDWYAGSLQRLRTALLSYPDGARVVVGARPMQAPTLARIADSALQAAQASGEDLAEAATVVFAAVRYTFGHVIEEQDSPTLTALDEASVQRFAMEFPAIAAVLTLGRSQNLTPERLYDNGLALILTRRAA